MYEEYIRYLRTIDYENFKNLEFKSDSAYQGILEHVSHELGVRYLGLIEKEYPSLVQNALDYISINDTYGSPKKYTFTLTNGFRLQCSPTSLRYVYHALVILDAYKKSGSKNIVEVGCGYGGLCLAINYFSKLVDVSIGTYNLVDMPEVCTLIKNYLALHSTVSTLKFHSCETYGANVFNTDLFFISNYCYTEIDLAKNKMYTSMLLPKAQHGFLIWQNGGNNGSYPVSQSSDILGKTVTHVEEEKPQTDAGYDRFYNYFVYF